MPRKERIIKAITKKPYVYSVIIIFFAYLSLNAFINKWYITLPSLIHANQWITIPNFIFSIVIAFLVAVALNLAYLRIRELQHVSKASGATFFGAFFGIMTGACPGCLVGIFPAIIGFFGGTLTLSSFPLFGIEIQLVTIILMIFVIRTLSKDNTCKIKK